MGVGRSSVGRRSVVGSAPAPSGAAAFRERARRAHRPMTMASRSKTPMASGWPAEVPGCAADGPGCAVGNPGCAVDNPGCALSDSLGGGVGGDVRGGSVVFGTAAAAAAAGGGGGGGGGSSAFAFFFSLAFLGGG